MMSAGDIWNNMPRQLVAILRGLQPGEAEAVTIALLEAGFRAIEVPLNRPDAVDAVEIAVRTAEAFGESCLVGAGTVLSASAVKQVQDAGGNLVVAPNHDPAVVRAARAAGMVAIPGVFTATEALAFIAAFYEAKKPIAAICHAPWLLIETGIANGLKATSYHSIKTDMKNAGADWVDEAVVVDQGIITSRNPDDLEAFCDKIAEETLEGRHEKRKVA